MNGDVAGGNTDDGCGGDGQALVRHGRGRFDGLRIPGADLCFNASHSRRWVPTNMKLVAFFTAIILVANELRGHTRQDNCCILSKGGRNV